MFTKNHYINIVSLVLIGLIGFLFLFKYSYIYLGNPYVISAIYLILFIIIFFFTGNLKPEKVSFLNRNIFKLLWAVICILVFAVITFTPRIGEIGRYPAIVDWLDRFFRGDFPYNSPHTPSGFPFLFFISYPFYLIGNTGHLELLGIIIFAVIVTIYSKTVKENLARFLLLAACPVFYYSIAVRDELFTSMMLIIGLIFLIEKYGKPDKINLSFLLYAILFGLTLSTRSVAALIYVIYFLYYFRNNLKNLIVFTVIVILIFSIILIPFILWDKESFLKNGPFAIQSFLSYLPMWNVALFILVSIYIGWIVSDLQEVFFACGVMLFIPVFLSMIYKVFEYGFFNAMINDIFDLSYYAFALPFLILSVKEYTVDRYLGKVLKEKY